MSSKKLVAKKHHQFMFTFLVNLGMCLYMSLTMHIVNIGYHSFATIWVKNFIISYLLSLPFIFLLVKSVAVMLDKFFAVKE